MTRAIYLSIGLGKVGFGPVWRGLVRFGSAGSGMAW